MVSFQDDYEKAMDVLADLAKEYEGWVRADLKRLNETFAAAQTNEKDRTRLIQSDLFRIAHDMKGQGATFDYDLITQIGNHLCRYIEKKSSYGQVEMDAIDKHIKALNQIVDNRLTGDGGSAGQHMSAQIEELV